MQTRLYADSPATSSAIPVSETTLVDAAHQQHAQVAPVRIRGDTVWYGVRSFHAFMCCAGKSDSDVGLVVERVHSPVYVAFVVP